MVRLARRARQGRVSAGRAGWLDQTHFTYASRCSVEQIHGIGQISAFEKQKLEEMKAELSSSIAKGLEFARNYKM